MDQTGETLLWQGTPSQWVNYNRYTLCVLLFLAAIAMPFLWNTGFQSTYPQYKTMVMLASKILFFLPAILALYFYLRVRTHRFTITTERLNEEFGILSKNTDVLELFRVKDLSFSQPLMLRVFGLGDIILQTSDKTTPIVVIHGIQDGQNLTSMIRKQVDIMRQKKGVREID